MSNEDEEKAALADFMALGGTEQKTVEPAENADKDVKIVDKVEKSNYNFDEIEIPDEHRKSLPQGMKKVTDLIKSYQELNSFRGRQGSEIAEQRKMIADLTNKVEGMVKKENPDMPKKAVEELSQEFIDKFIENPTGKLKEVFEPILEERLKKIEEAYEKRLSRFESVADKAEVTELSTAFALKENLSLEAQDAIGKILFDRTEWYNKKGFTREEALDDALFRYKATNPAKPAEEPPKAPTVLSSGAAPKKSTEPTEEQALREFLSMGA